MMVLESHTKLQHIYGSNNLIGKIRDDLTNVEFCPTDISIVKNEKIDVLSDIIEENLDGNELRIDKTNTENDQEGIKVTKRDEIVNESNKAEELEISKAEVESFSDFLDVSVYEVIKKSLTWEEKKKARLHCKICDKDISFLYFFSNHLPVHLGKLPFECSICRKRFTANSDLRRHVRIVHSVNAPFKCEICEKYFKASIYLKAHQTSHTDNTRECKICGRSFKHLKSHMRKYHEDNNWKSFCEICGKCVVDLIIHKASHNPKDSFTCAQCGKQFKARQSLIVHIKTHSDSRNYMCSDCGKWFKSAKTYRGHMRKHTGLKPFACTVCDKTFNDSGTLYKHRLIHSGECRYSCEKCQKTFRYSQQLKNHLKNNHITDVKL